MRKVGIVAGLLTIFIHFAAKMGLQDKIFIIYSKCIFPVIRTVYDCSLGYLPFPFIYIIFLLFSIFVFILVFRYFTVVRVNNARFSAFKRLFFITNMVGWVYFLFYFLWAFNYYRPSLESKLDLPKVYIDSAILSGEMSIVTEKINSLRSQIRSSGTKYSCQPNWIDLEEAIRMSQVDLLHTWGVNAIGRVRIRALYPKGLLLRISTAGVYIPFSCEGHVDPGLNVLQWPFTMAHEMAHGYGFTDEGECNFVGFLTCISSKDLDIQYSGWLAYWRYLYFRVKESSPVAAQEMYCNLNSLVISDLTAIKSDLNRYPDLFPRLRDAIYEYYLKSNGVKEGLNSYTGIIQLVLRWKKLNFNN